MTTHNPDKIWTRLFVLLCMAEFLGYGHNAMLTPTIPLYVTHLGGSPFLVGVILAAFSVASVLIRPVIGSWANVWSYIGILSLGCLLLGLSVLLFLFPFAAIFIVANGFRGIGWAGLNTGGYSQLAHSAPATRRGEASGYYSGFQGGAHVFFPALALWFFDAQWGGFNLVILFSSILALIGSSIGLLPKRLTERTISNVPPATGQRKGRPGIFTFVDRNVLVAATLLLCLNLSLPATTGFLVLYTREIGVEGMGWYFAATGLTNVVTRPALGWVSDRIGRGRSNAIAFGLELGGLLLLLVAPNLAVVVIGGVVYATGNAMGTSSMIAMAIAMAEPQRLGTTMATFSMAYPLSMGLGAFLTGAIIDVAGFPWMFIAAMIAVVLGFLVTVLCWSRLERTSHSA